MALGWPKGEVWSCRSFLWDVGRVHAEYHSQSRPCPIPRDQAFATVRDRVLYGILQTTVWAGAAARRAFVETMSWIVTYHVKITVAGNALECRFFHTLPHAALGVFLSIRVSPDVAPFVYMCKVSYIGRLYDFLASDAHCGGTYAMSKGVLL
jgi:hypothetical protein